MTEENKILNRNKILIGLEKAYEKMIAFKKAHNSELVIIQNNKIVKLRETSYYNVFANDQAKSDLA